MIDRLTIRYEEAGDINQVNQIIESAFEDHPQGNAKEHLLVSELRAENALSISLVAEDDGKIVGHIAFSEVTINGVFCSWYGLAPVSVHPEYQNRGVGSRLIEHGLNDLKNIGAKGCVLVGEPTYYKRFGFRQQNKLTYEGVPKEYFLVQSFGEEIPTGQVKYHSIFDKFG